MDAEKSEAAEQIQRSLPWMEENGPLCPLNPHHLRAPREVGMDGPEK